MRHSDDGLDWTESNGPGGEAISGVGAAASNDAVGVSRLVGYRGATGKLRLRFGLGTDNWESQESEFAAQDFSSQPAAIHADGAKWLLSTTDNQGHAALSMFDTSTRQFVNQTPSGIPGTFQNNTPGRTPALARIGSRIVAAWPRFAANGVGAPVALQFVLGTLSAGSVQWERGVTPALAAANLDQVVSGPALAQDGARFYAAVIRKSSSTEIRRLFVFQSTDAVLWQQMSDLALTAPGSNPKVGLAARPDGSMVVIVLGDTDQFFLRRGDSWTGLSVGNVFGTDNPGDDFAVIGVGQQRLPLFVNRSSTATSHDGTDQGPFLTIAGGLAAARPGDTVIIQDNGLYQEGDLRVPRGVTLQASSTLAMPLIRGNNQTPVIRLERNATVRGLSIDGGTQGVLVEVGVLLQGLAGSVTDAGVTIEDCKIENAREGAIKLFSGTDLVVGDGKIRIVTLTVRRNWLSLNIGGSLVSDVTGPAEGTLPVVLAITDNVVRTLSDGIRLRAVGRGAGTQVRTFYTGRIFNNLMAGNLNGVTLQALNRGEVGRADDPLVVENNTIAGSSANAIIAEALDNVSRVAVALRTNIIANNAGDGYQEGTTRTTATEIRRNVFFGNLVNYRRADLVQADTAAQLNGGVVNGVNNLVADPRFEAAPFRFSLSSFGTGEGSFFLRQGGANASPAVDAGLNSATAAGLASRSTRADYVSDNGVADIGFHYRNPT